MKLINVIGLTLGAGLAFVASAAMSDSAFVTIDQPHATLESMTQAQVDKSHYPAYLVRVDGKPVITREQRSFYLMPGQHTLSFMVDWEKVKRYEPNNSLNPEVPKMQTERKITMNFQEGQVYTFGVLIKNFEYANWQPYVNGPGTDSANDSK